MHLKGALHTHTNCSDGELTIEECVRLHAERGFDFVAFTDHDYLLKPGCYDGLKKIDTDLILLAGVEMTVFEKGYVHVGRIEGDGEVLHIFNHPGQLDLPMEKVIERIGEVGKRIPLDAVEITSEGFKTPEYDIPEIPFHKVATDDSHHPHMIGRAWVEMDCARNKNDIIRAIKRGDFWNCYVN